MTPFLGAFCSAIAFQTTDNPDNHPDNNPDNRIATRRWRSCDWKCSVLRCLAVKRIWCVWGTGGYPRRYSMFPAV